MKLPQTFLILKNYIVKNLLSKMQKVQNGQILTP